MTRPSPVNLAIIRRDCKYNGSVTWTWTGGHCGWRPTPVWWPTPIRPSGSTRAAPPPAQFRPPRPLPRRLPRRWVEHHHRTRGYRRRAMPALRHELSRTRATPWCWHSPSQSGGPPPPASPSGANRSADRGPRRSRPPKPRPPPMS